jgi:putative membrane protein
MKQSLVTGKISFITYSIALILTVIGTIMGVARFWEYYTRIDIFVGIIILLMVFVNISIWWYVAAGWISTIGRMIDLQREGNNYKRHWSYLFFLFSSGLLFWGASTFILSVSSSVDEFYITPDTGRNLLVLSIVGAIIISLIGIWISARTSNAQRQQKTA